MQIRSTSLQAFRPASPTSAAVPQSIASHQTPPADSFQSTFVEPPPPGYDPTSRESLKTSAVIGAGTLGAALGVYSGLATGVAPAIVGGTIGALAGGIAGATAGFFPDLSNSISGKPTNYMGYLGGAGLLAGGVVGAVVGGQVSNGPLALVAGVATGLTSAFAAGLVAKEMN